MPQVRELRQSESTSGLTIRRKECSRKCSRKEHSVYQRSPITSAPNEKLNTNTLVPTPQTAENQAIAEAVMTTTGATGGLILTASVPQTLQKTLHVPIALQVAPPNSSPTENPAVSVPSLTVPMASSTTSTPIINTPN